MSNSDWNKGRDIGQKNPNQQVATPQQIPNHQERQDYNNGVRHGQNNPGNKK